MSATHVRVAINAYAGIEGPAFGALADLESACARDGITMTKSFTYGSALLVQSRCDQVGTFLGTNATHLLMLDADIGYPAELVSTLLACNEDFIACPAPYRQFPLRVASFGLVGSTAKTSPRKGRLIEIDSAGGACLFVRRAAIEKMVAAYPELGYRSASNPALMCSGLFLPMVENAQLISEDVAFCHRWRKLGGKVWAHLDMEMTHHGPYTFRGSLGQQIGERAPIVGGSCPCGSGATWAQCHGIVA